MRYSLPDTSGVPSRRTHPASVATPAVAWQPANHWRPRSAWARFALGVALLAPIGLSAADYQTWITGNPDDARPAATRPGLFLSGGGGDVAAAWRWFVSCAGGGDIVVLRASGGDGYQDYVFREIGGVDSVQTIVFNQPAAARDPQVLAALAAADGIFMAGGDQAKYITFWRGTPVMDALNAHLRAGKPLGGTSAGLAVMGGHYFSALKDTITSEAALRDPFDERVTLGQDFIAAPGLARVITDSHFMARARLGRLITFLARIETSGVSEKFDSARPARPQILGLGIDEATAACVEPDGSVQIHSEKKGLAWLVVPSQLPEKLVRGQPLAVRGVDVIGLGPETRFNLLTLTVDRPAALRRVRAESGRLVEDPSRP